jgi:hypothetical protein
MMKCWGRSEVALDLDPPTACVLETEIKDLAAGEKQAKTVKISVTKKF